MSEERKLIGDIVKEVITLEEKTEGLLGFEVSLDCYPGQEDLRMRFFYLPNGETQVQNRSYEYKHGVRTK